MKVDAFAVRNLQLLNTIESTLDALDSDNELIDAIESTYQEIKQSLAASDTPIDVAGNLENTFGKASDACSRLYHWTQKRHSVLSPGDGVVNVHVAFMESLRRLHDTIEQIREWVASHDAALESATSGAFNSADDLFKSLLPKK